MSELSEPKTLKDALRRYRCQRRTIASLQSDLERAERKARIAYRMFEKAGSCPTGSARELIEQLVAALETAARSGPDNPSAPRPDGFALSRCYHCDKPWGAHETDCAVGLAYAAGVAAVTQRERDIASALEAAAQLEQYRLECASDEEDK